MGGNENDKTVKEKDKEKEAKTPPTAPTQEHSSTTIGAVNPDWNIPLYCRMDFWHLSPQAHPYMWGVQHIMPPYGAAPHPYVAMYPHGGIYAHPSMPLGSYPFSLFAMPSPNGIAEASLSFLCHVLLAFFTYGTSLEVYIEL